MNSLKSHITLILALTSIMLSVFLFRIFSQILYKYQLNIADNYSIIIVSSKKIDSLPIREIKAIKPINIENEINKLKNKYKNIDFSNIQIPYFYRLRLNKLPSPEELTVIQKTLKNLPFIKKIMTKTSSQTKIYNLLMLLKIVTKTFMLLIGILGFLLILKQLEVWKLLHSERMYIMELFGAPFWFKGAALFKIAFMDSLIALVFTFAFVYLIINSVFYVNVINELGIYFKPDFIREFLILIMISFLISFISSVLVIIGKK